MNVDPPVMFPSLHQHTTETSNLPLNAQDDLVRSVHAARTPTKRKGRNVVNA
jgi:hypothetical protein